MKYKRNRTQSLTIRLTPTEKEMLRSRADAKHMSMTDYLLLSALNQSNAVLYQPILQKLCEIKEQLKKAIDLGDAEIYDTLELHKEVCSEIMKSIRKG